MIENEVNEMRMLERWGPPFLSFRKQKIMIGGFEAFMYF